MGRINHILSSEIVQTQKKLVAKRVKTTPKFLPSTNHRKIENDEEDDNLKYASQPKVIKNRVRPI